MSKFSIYILLLTLVVTVSIASPLVDRSEENLHLLSRRQISPIQEDPIFKSVVKQALIDLENVPSDPFGRGLQVIDPAFSRAAAAILDDIHTVAKAMIPQNQFEIGLTFHSLYKHAQSLVSSCAPGVVNRDVKTCLYEFASLGLTMATRFICASVHLETARLAGAYRVSANMMCSAATFYLAAVIRYAMLHQIPLENLLEGRFRKLSRGIVSGNYIDAYEGLDTLQAPIERMVKKVNSMELVTEGEIERIGVDLPE